MHDLAELMKLCKTNRIPLPEYAMSFIALSPFAVMGRYDLMPDDDIDFDAISACINQFSEWVGDQLKKDS